MSQSASAILEIPKTNWTNLIFQRQIFGKKIPSKRKSPVENTSPVERRALRAFQLREMVPSLEDFEDVFIGFSLCGCYLVSYREVVGTAEGEEENVGLFGILDTEWTYVLTVWWFIPGDKLRTAFKVKLFEGLSFSDSLCIRLQQHPDLPGGCVVTGCIPGKDSSNLTKTLWHTIFFIPSAPMPTLDNAKSFIVFAALSSEISSYGGYLVVVTSDELILYNLKQELEESRRPALITDPLEMSNEIPRFFRQLVGPQEVCPRKYVYYFPYAQQTLRWCTEDCEATLNSSCVGLSDYHLHVDEISDGICNGSIIALYAVDTDVRYYFESMFTFEWNFGTGEFTRMSCRTNDVTSRSREPRKQYEAFNKLRASLFGNLKKNTYNLDNIPVLKGRSLQRIFDSSGHIALTL